jgi:hypothetical protein
MSRSAFKGKWQKDPRAEALIKDLKPQFGNAKHARAGAAWGKLMLLYAKDVKGEKTRNDIAELEQEIISQLAV